MHLSLASSSAAAASYILLGILLLLLLRWVHIWICCCACLHIKAMAKLVPVNKLASHIVSQIGSREWKSIYAAQSPLLLKGLCRTWRAYSKWSDPEYLKSVAGQAVVPVEMGGSYIDPDMQQELVEFAGFIDFQSAHKHQTHSATETRVYAYLAQYDIRSIPALSQDYSAPALTRTGDSSLYKVNLWMGSTDTYSPSHYDPFQNILCQVYGTKRVILHDPRFSEQLYPHHRDLKLKNTSQVDVETPDLTKFPKFSDCYGLVANLEPGDGLFIPLRWWHFCKATSASCSVNFWWR